MEEEMKTDKIPQTGSIQELARFWDRHDVTEFEDPLEEVEKPILEREPGASLTIRLEREELEALRRMASRRGVQEAALLREWVLEEAPAILMEHGIVDRSVSAPLTAAKHRGRERFELLGTLPHFRKSTRIQILPHRNAGLRASHGARLWSSGGTALRSYPASSSTAIRV
jgi:hypothetical protein